MPAVPDSVQRLRLRGVRRHPRDHRGAGALVEARFCGMDEWYPGRVVRVAEDGAVDIEYEDGDYETALPPGHVRERAGG